MVTDMPKFMTGSNYVRKIKYPANESFKKSDTVIEYCTTNIEDAVTLPSLQDNLKEQKLSLAFHVLSPISVFGICMIYS